MDSLFGPGDGIQEPWFAYHKCERKEVNQDTLDFLHKLVGLSGEYHDGQRGYILDMHIWNALLQYVHLCEEQGMNIQILIEKVNSNDAVYEQLVGKRLRAFMDRDNAMSAPSKQHQEALISTFQCVLKRHLKEKRGHWRG